MFPVETDLVTDPNARSSQMTARIAVGLTLLVLIVFWGVHRYPFFSADDPGYVLRNPLTLQGFTWSGIVTAFTTIQVSNYHPLTMISLMIDQSIFDSNAGGFHLTSLALHLSNTILLFVILRRTTSQIWPSAIVAALFAVHPLHVEPVVWISSRKDVLSGFFGLWTIWWYVRYVENQDKRYYLLAVASLALGLLSKQMLVTFPFLLCLLDYWPLNRYGERITAPNIRRFTIEKWPLFLSAVVFSIAVYYAQSATEVVRGFDEVPFVDRAKNALVAYALYIGQTLVPTRLQVIGYETPIGIPLWQPILAGLSLAAATVFSLMRLRAMPFLAVGWFWFLGTLVPVIGFVSLSVNYRADRYTYLPIIGLFIMAAWSIHWLAQRFEPARKPTYAIAGTLLIILPYAATGWIQTRHWSDNVRILRQTLAVDPDHVQSNFALANTYVERQQYEPAVEHYLAVLRRMPEFADVAFRTGFALQMLGNYPQAQKFYQNGLDIEPDNPNGWLGLAEAQARQGNRQAAETNLAEAQRLAPESTRVDTEIERIRRLFDEHP